MTDWMILLVRARTAATAPISAWWAVLLSWCTDSVHTQLSMDARESVSASVSVYCVWVWVCVFVFLCLCLCLCLYLYLCLCLCLHLCLCLRLCLCLCLRPHLCLCVFAYVCLWLWMCTCVCVCACIWVCRHLFVGDTELVSSLTFNTSPTSSHHVEPLIFQPNHKYMYAGKKCKKPLSSFARCCKLVFPKMGNCVKFDLTTWVCASCGNTKGIKTPPCRAYESIEPASNIEGVSWYVLCVSIPIHYKPSWMNGKVSWNEFIYININMYISMYTCICMHLHCHLSIYVFYKNASVYYCKHVKIHLYKRTYIYIYVYI